MEDTGGLQELTEELVVLPDEALIERQRALELEQRRVTAEAAMVSAVIDSRGAFTTDGHRSLKGFLKANSNVSGRTANQRRRLSRTLNWFPDIAAALLDGRLGIDQAQKLSDLHHHKRASEWFAEFVEMLLDAAIRFSWDDFCKVVDRFLLGADPDGAERDRDDAVAGRDARVGQLGAGLDAMAHGGDAVTAAECQAIFEQFVDDEYQLDLKARRDEHGVGSLEPLRRTPAQRRFDAFVKMVHAAGAQRAADAEAAGAAPIKYNVNLVMGPAAFQRMLQTAGLVPTVEDTFDDVTDLEGLRDFECRTADGAIVAPDDALRVLLLGTITRVIVDQKECTINYGRSKRLFAGSAKDAAMVLLTECPHPGCDIPARWCQVDHNLEWWEHGRTDQDNAGPECGHHNVWKHGSGARYRIDADARRRLTRADGSLMLPVGMPPPIFPTDDDVQDVVRQRAAAERARQRALRCRLRKLTQRVRDAERDIAQPGFTLIADRDLV